MVTKLDQSHMLRCFLFLFILSLLFFYRYIWVASNKHYFSYKCRSPKKNWCHIKPLHPHNRHLSTNATAGRRREVRLPYAAALTTYYVISDCVANPSITINCLHLYDQWSLEQMWLIWRFENCYNCCYYRNYRYRGHVNREHDLHRDRDLDYVRDLDSDRFRDCDLINIYSSPWSWSCSYLLSPSPSTSLTTSSSRLGMFVIVIVIVIEFVIVLSVIDIVSIVLAKGHH